MRGIINSKGVRHIARLPLPCGLEAVAETFLKGRCVHGGIVENGIASLVMSQPEDPRDQSALDDYLRSTAWVIFCNYAIQQLRFAPAGSDKLDDLVRAAIDMMPDVFGRAIAPPKGTSPTRDTTVARSLLPSPWSWTRLGPTDPSGPNRYWIAAQPFEAEARRIPETLDEEMWCMRAWSAADQPLALCATALWSAESYLQRHVYRECHRRILAG